MVQLRRKGNVIWSTYKISRIFYKIEELWPTFLRQIIFPSFLESFQSRNLAEYRSMQKSFSIVHEFYLQLYSTRKVLLAAFFCSYLASVAVFTPIKTVKTMWTWGHFKLEVKKRRKVSFRPKTHREVGEGAYERLVEQFHRTLLKLRVYWESSLLRQS